LRLSFFMVLLVKPQGKKGKLSTNIQPPDEQRAEKLRRDEDAVFQGINATQLIETKRRAYKYLLDPLKRKEKGRKKGNQSCCYSSKRGGKVALSVLEESQNCYVGSICDKKKRKKKRKREKH